MENVTVVSSVTCVLFCVAAKGEMVSFPTGGAGRECAGPSVSVGL